MKLAFQRGSEEEVRVKVLLAGSNCKETFSIWLSMCWKKEIFGGVEDHALPAACIGQQRRLQGAIKNEFIHGPDSADGSRQVRGILDCIPVRLIQTNH